MGLDSERDRRENAVGRPLRPEVVCPCCHAALGRLSDGALRCLGCAALFPRRAAVDVLLDDAEWEALVEHVAAECGALTRYRSARRESPLNIMYYDHWVSWMLEEVPDHTTGPALELMCGEAEVTRRLPPRFAGGFAIDLNVDMVEHAANALSSGAGTPSNPAALATAT